MKRFSVVDFEGEVYVLPGKVDKYALESFDPVKDQLEGLETSEILKVFYTIYWLNDGSDTNSDLAEADIDEVTDMLGDLLQQEGALTVTATGKIELNGVLTQPFEDAYGLVGEERERYLASKKAAQEEIAQLTAEMEAKGMTPDEIENWFRFKAIEDSAEDDEDDT